MGYPKDLLSDGEHVEFELRPHWRALVVPVTVTIAVIIGLIVLLNYWKDWFSDSDAVDSVGTWVFVIGGIFLFAVFAVRPFLYWITTQYVFTDRRIIIRSGLIAREGKDMPLSKVNNVSFSVSVFGRLLNYGTLEIDSASDESLIIDDVPNVERIQREVNRLHEEDSERRSGRDESA